MNETENWPVLFDVYAGEIYVGEFDAGDEQTAIERAIWESDNDNIPPGLKWRAVAKQEQS